MSINLLDLHFLISSELGKFNQLDYLPTNPFPFDWRRQTVDCEDQRRLSLTITIRDARLNEESALLSRHTNWTNNIDLTRWVWTCMWNNREAKSKEFSLSFAEATTSDGNQLIFAMENFIAIYAIKQISIKAAQNEKKQWSKFILFTDRWSPYISLLSYACAIFAIQSSFRIINNFFRSALGFGMGFRSDDDGRWVGC